MHHIVAQLDVVLMHHIVVAQLMIFFWKWKYHSGLLHVHAYSHTAQIIHHLNSL
jgi:hypothetical protein